MIPTSFNYSRAASLDDALQALAANDGTKVIAGGHSLLPVMKFRLAQPAALVDIAHLPELRGISETAGGVRIGAATTYRDLLESALLKQRFPIIAETTQNIGDLQVRNRGTIGGSLAHADPASDMPAVMLVLDASFGLRSKTGQRSVKAREFFLGAFSTMLAEDELLIDIVLPPLPAGAGTAYVSYNQAASGYAVVGAAAMVVKQGGKISKAVAALTGLGEIAALVNAADQLVGSNGDRATLEKIGQAAAAGLDVQGDIHAPTEYRRHLITVALREALAKALERAR